MLSPTNNSRKRRTEYGFNSEIVTAITTRNAVRKDNNRKTQKKVDHHNKTGEGGTQVIAPSVLSNVYLPFWVTLVHIQLLWDSY
jgi:hypothetical protein